MIPYQITSAFLGLAISGTILYLIRRDLVHGRHAAWWLLAAMVIVLVSFFPRLVDKMAGILGIQYPPTLIFILGMALILVKLLTMDIDITHQERRIRRLVQRVALLEAEIARTREGKAGNDDPHLP